MKTIKILVFVALLGLTLIAAGCVASKSGTFIGETKPLGNGMVRSWVTLDNDGKPQAIGITFTEAALSGLPTTLPTTEYQLALPQQASAMPFKHIVVNWNPQGHVPPGIYDVPHFDFHFYMISPEERSTITATGDDLVKVEKKPALELLPANYPKSAYYPTRYGMRYDAAAKEYTVSLEGIMLR